MNAKTSRKLRKSRKTPRKNREEIRVPKAGGGINKGFPPKYLPLLGDGDAYVQVEDVDKYD